jgi:hypothetical protein
MRDDWHDHRSVPACDPYLWPRPGIPAPVNGGGTVIAKPDESPSSDDRARPGLSLLSRTGPEVPPDVAAAPPAQCLVETTETLPIIAPRAEAAGSVPPPAETPVPPAARVAARAVIVYETPPRRPWRLWVFTAVIVALTVGVVLGQAVAWQPVSRTASAAAAQVVPAPSVPPSAVPTRPGPGQQVTVPLGSARSRLLEVTGAATLLRIRSADLGSTLLHAAALDSSAVPSWTDTGKGTRLELVRTGTPGTAGLDIQLNARVSWTIRLTGGAAEQDVDMRAGGLAALRLTGGGPLVVLRLPKPKGTVPVAVASTVGRLSVATKTGTPVRLRLARGAGVVSVDRAKQRTVRTPPGWKTAKNRYDLTTSGAVGSVAVTHG